MAGRIKRGPAPKRAIKWYNYREVAWEALRRDFQDRCAYSCQHMNCAGGQRAMEVDHFDPRRKNDSQQSYRNLMLASHHCNSAKHDNWPTRDEQALGMHFLNPCEEEDYGVQIFEYPEGHEKSHHLVGVTPAGRYQITTCDLNADHLVRERRHRTELRRMLEGQPVTVKGGFQVPPELEQIKAIVDEMIFAIPPPPPPWLA